MKEGVLFNLGYSTKSGNTHECRLLSCNDKIENGEIIVKIKLNNSEKPVGIHIGCFEQILEEDLRVLRESKELEII